MLVFMYNWCKVNYRQDTASDVTLTSAFFAAAPQSEQHTNNSSTEWAAHHTVPAHTPRAVFPSRLKGAFGLALQSIWPIWLVSQLYNCCGSSSWEWMSGVLVWFECSSSKSSLRNTSQLSQLHSSVHFCIPYMSNMTEYHLSSEEESVVLLQDRWVPFYI